MNYIDEVKINLFISTLKKCTKGSIKITDPSGEIVEINNNSDVTADIKINDWSIINNLIKNGDVGFASDYRDGKWSSTNLKDLFTFVIINDKTLSRLLFGQIITRFFSNIKYIFNKNTIKGSKKNIEAHYDLGNNFYKIWLDKSLTYSSALFTDENTSLFDAQMSKYKRINDILKTPRDNKLLEIGTGWGGFLSYAKKDFDSLDSITISKEQYSFSREVHKDNSNISISYDDYRNINSTYNSIVSIEMFEAVGQEYWDTYFQKINSLLVKNGKAVIQTITIDDKLFDSYRNSTDAIRTFIFPGGMLPSPSIFSKYANNNGFKIIDKFSFGESYSKTLDIWHDVFKSNIDNISKLNFDDKFIRIWEYYLTSCSSSFINERTNVYQFTLQKI
jgi:cyclopropane-fatty-acyl-phospholipid synthase|tara:strand:+ start:2572 stop:3741 length:1170 start_codon:yes stop_codon:yes gene_type:complete